MLNRLARFKCDTWIRYAVVTPKDGDLQQFDMQEIPRKGVMGRMYNREGRLKVERFIIGYNNLYIMFDDVKEGKYIYKLNDNYTFQKLCSLKEWPKSQYMQEYIEKYKKIIAIEKLSGNKHINLLDNMFSDTNNLRITVTLDDINYEIPTHWEYVSIDQKMFYVELENNELVAKEIEYDQMIYFNNNNTYASYINIPKERMYIILNASDYHEKAHQDECIIYLDGKPINPGNKSSLSDCIENNKQKLKANLLEQTISALQFVDLNNQNVEFYIDCIEQKEGISHQSY